MTTTFRLYGGPLNGRVSTVDVSAIFDVSAIEPDSTTLQIPAGFTLEDALRRGQLRIIVEAVTPASVPNRILRYRNGDDSTTWRHVDAAGNTYCMVRHERSVQLAAERDGAARVAAQAAQAQADRERQ